MVLIYLMRIVWMMSLAMLMVLASSRVQADQADPRPRDFKFAVCYKVSIDLPEFAATSEQAKIIRNVEDWSTVNDPRYRFFYVYPGDYREAGTITLTASGAPREPRWLMWHDPENPEDTTTHPYHMPAGQQAFIDKLQMDGASRWVIDRIRWNRMVVVTNGSSHNVINRCLALEIDTSGGRQCLVVRDNSNFNTIQNCVFADTPPMPHQDCCGIYVTNADHTRIVRNEIRNMPGDSIQTGQSRDHARGTIIQDNDLYVKPATYSDGRGNFTPSGNYSSAENAIDIKAHWQPLEQLPPEQDQYLIIEGNRMWGFRVTDPAAGSTGSGGSHVVIHYRTSSAVRMRYNLVFDGVVGYSCSFKSQRGENQPQFHDLHDNIFWDIRPRWGRGAGIALQVSEAWDSSYYNNIFVDCAIFMDMNRPSQNQKSRPYARRNSFGRNVVINSGPPCRTDYHDSNSFALSAYFGTTPLPQNQDDGASIVAANVAAARHLPLRVLIKHITDPTEIEIPMGKVTPQSPHAEWFGVPGAPSQSDGQTRRGEPSCASN